MTDFANHTAELRSMLEGMTKADLIQYGRLTYGLSLTAKLTQLDMITAILSAASKFKLNERIEVGDRIDEEELAPGMAEIQIHRSERDKKQRSAIIGLNGKMASLPVGIRFRCPIEFLQILDDAVQFTYDQMDLGDGATLQERPVHSYPFTVFAKNPHTPETLAKSRRTRGLKGRPEGAAAKARARRTGNDLAA